MIIHLMINNVVIDDFNDFRMDDVTEDIFKLFKILDFLGFDGRQRSYCDLESREIVIESFTDDDRDKRYSSNLEMQEHLTSFLDNYIKHDLTWITGINSIDFDLIKVIDLSYDPKF